MKKKLKKKKTFFIVAIVLTLLIISSLVLYNIFNESMLKELDIKEVIEKVDNKDSFVLCISQTTCQHCAIYKPKLEKIAEKYNIEIFYIDIDKYEQDEIDTFKKRISFDGSTPVTAFIVDGNESSIASRLFGNVSNDKVINKLKTFEFIKEK